MTTKPRIFHIVWNADMTEGVVFTDEDKVRAIETGGRHGVHSELGEFFSKEIAGEDVIRDEVRISSVGN